MQKLDNAPDGAFLFSRSIVGLIRICTLCALRTKGPELHFLLPVEVHGTVLVEGDIESAIDSAHEIGGDAL